MEKCLCIGWWARHPLVSHVAVVFLVTAGLFVSTARFEFVNYDDPEYIYENPHIRDGLTPKGVLWAVKSAGYADNWHPMTWISFMADVSLVRLARGAVTPEEWKDRGNSVSHVMHLHNALLHAANAALLYLLLLVIVRGRIGSVWLLLLSLLWSLHPLRTEVVCWVTERKELSSCFFMLLALILHFEPERKSVWRSACFFACSALAMAAKPVAVTLPAVLLAWDWIIVGRIRWVRLIAVSAMSAATCCLTIASQTVSMDSGSKIPLVSKLMTTFVSPLVYVRQTFWPFGLSPIYEMSNELNVWAFAGGIVLIVALVAVCIAWLVCRNRVLGVLAFAVGWVYVGLIPMLGIVKVGGQEHSDRYTYWIGCGVCASLALLAVELWPKLRPRLEAVSPKGREDVCELRRVVLYGTIAIVGVLAYITYLRIPVWRSTLILYRDTIPKSWSTEIAYTLNHELEDKGEEAKAEGEMWLRGCVNNHPSVLGRLNLADVLLRKPPDPASIKFGMKLYGEVELLIDQALYADPDADLAEKAKKMKEVLEAKRKAAKDVQGK